jgi:hypothetical protein
MARPHAGLYATYDADTVRLLGKSFDEAWDAIAGHYGSRSAADAARQRLAKIILGLAPSDGIPDAELIKYSALVAMRRKESASAALQRARAHVVKEQKIR